MIPLSNDAPMAKRLPDLLDELLSIFLSPIRTDASEINNEVPGITRFFSSEGFDEGAVLLLGLLVMVGSADTDGE